MMGSLGDDRKRKPAAHLPAHRKKLHSASVAREKGCNVHREMLAYRIRFEFRQKIATLWSCDSKKIGINACHAGSSEVSSDIRLDPRTRITDNVAGFSLACNLIPARGHAKIPTSQEREANTGEHDLMGIICAVDHTLGWQTTRFGPRKTYDG
jgi:hypothetical protein